MSEVYKLESETRGVEIVDISRSTACIMAMLLARDWEQDVEVVEGGKTVETQTEEWYPSSVLSNIDLAHSREFRLVLTSKETLNDNQLAQAAGATMYAFTSVLAIKEEDWNPYKINKQASKEYSKLTGRNSYVIDFVYDPTKSIRSAPDFHQAFDTATQFISHGTPKRTTDREGPGTKNTSLIPGIGKVKAEFLVKA